MTTHRRLVPCLLTTLAWFCGGFNPAAAAEHDGDGIAWQHASNDAEVDRAFAQAKAETKPVFVYWGAKWCPPCNQVKATLFNRQDFIHRSRAFVPVYIDGDSPGAQKLGARFRVSGYPTMLLFNPQGIEMTRLPGEVDAARYTEVLTLGMNAQRPVSEVLRQALAGGAGLSRQSEVAYGIAQRRRLGLKGAPAAPLPKDAQPLTPNDWRLLAFYSWETDQQRLVPPGGVPALLRKLAGACPPEQAELAQRLRLQSWAASEGRPAQPDARSQAMLLALLADASASRAQMDVLTNSAADITRALTAAGTPPRQTLLTAFDAALARLEADATLSRADRLAALSSRVDLARIDVPKGASPAPMPQALLADVRATTARDDREITDGYERQAVITAAADTLQQAGLGAESDALLKANLAKSHSPYYLMSELAGHARQRGDRADALHWYEQAFDKSEGPATRLQWGGSYLAALVDMAPQDDAPIERTTSELFTEAATLPDAFEGRSGRSLQRVGAKLQAWNKGGSHRATMGRLQARLGGVCAKLPGSEPSRASCEALLKPAAKPSL